MSEELLPCPWCKPGESHFAYSGSCVRCTYHTDWIRIVIWNRRAPLSTQPKGGDEPCPLPNSDSLSDSTGSNAAPTGPIPADAATPKRYESVEDMMAAQNTSQEVWCKYTKSLQRELAQALKERDNWIDSAAQYARNEEFYHSLVVAIGEPFGVAAKTSDDGSIQDHVLALKVPELVASLRAQVAAVTQERDELKKLE